MLNLIRGGNFIVVLLILLLVAVITDLSVTRIPNLIIITGLVSGIFYRVLCKGERNYFMLAVGILLPIIVFFPLFLIRAMGAGDIKLLAVTGAFFTIKENMECIVVAILIAGVIALIKIVAEKNIRERIKYLFVYLAHIYKYAVAGNFYEKPYMDTEDKVVVKKAGIKFSLPVLLGVIIVMGGNL